MNTVQLTRRNARLFSRKPTQPAGGSAARAALDSARFTDCRSLLLQCREMYDRLALQRAKMRSSARSATPRSKPTPKVYCPESSREPSKSSPKKAKPATSCKTWHNKHKLPAKHTSG